MRKWKITTLLLISAFAGVAGLWYLDSYFPKDERPSTYHVLLHTFSLLSTVGLVGIVFEFFLREDLTQRIVNALLESFDTNTKVAQALSMTARQRRVENTLKAHLGEQRGEAIYNSIVSPYLSQQRPFREEYFYEAVIRPLVPDVEIKKGSNEILLKGSDYYRLEVRCSFKREFGGPRRVSIGCILRDDYEELYWWFRRSGCLFRETVILADSDLSGFVSLLRKRTVCDVWTKCG